MNPPAQEVSRIWHRRLTFAYVLIAWTTLGFVVSQIKSKDPNFNFNPLASDDPEDKLSKIARNMQLRNPVIYRITPEGITKKKIDMMRPVFGQEEDKQEE